MNDLFELRKPAGTPLPLLVDVPHAGEHEPEHIRSQLLAPYAVRKRDFDLYVDQFWRDAPGLGATLLKATHSRYVVDLNRDHRSVDGGSVAGHPAPAGTYRRGLLWQVTSAGEPVLGAPLPRTEYRRRVAQFHAPYHAMIRDQLRLLHEMYGHVVLIDAHSMPSVGREDHLDEGQPRAHIVPGTNHGQSCSDTLSSLCVEVFSDHGYQVKLDDPYRGGWITRHYGRPAEGCHAIQIEVSRSLYMDESTFEIDETGLQRLRAACRAFAETAGAWRP